VCKENRVEKRQEPLSLPLQMPVMLLNKELKTALLILSSRNRRHLGPPVTGGVTRCANWLASCVPAARNVTKSLRFLIFIPELLEPFQFLFLSLS